MFVLNPKNLKNATNVKINVGKHIVKKFNIPPIYKDKEWYYFTRTHEFEEAIKKLPFWLRKAE